MKREFPRSSVAPGNRSLDRGRADTPAYNYVDTPSALGDLVAEMKHADRIAVDTEADSLHHYYEKTCLIQVTFSARNYIVDPLAELDLHPFLSVLADSHLIFHGGDYDLRMMRASLSFEPRNRVFDTLIAAQLLGYEGISLLALARDILGIGLSKSGQRSDWARRPLTSAQLAYAVDDTRYLETLADKLSEDLGRLGRLDWHRESCERMVRATATTRNNRDPKDAWRIKGLRSLDRRQLAFVREIWHWREKEAQQADRPPFRIMGNQTILDLALWTSSHVGPSLNGGPKLPRHCTGSRLAALEKAVQRVHGLPESEYPDHRRGKRFGPDFTPQVKAMQVECAKLAAELGIDPAVLAPKAALLAAARKQARTTDEIAVASELTRWQAHIITPAICHVLDTIEPPQDPTEPSDPQMES